VSWLRQDSPAHLGDALAGLVDGHLDHDARERALSHLARCGACRLEVEGLRRLRAQLLDLGARPVGVPTGLAERLLALDRAASPAPVRAQPPVWVTAPRGGRPPGPGPSSRRPSGRPALPRAPRVPRAAAAGAALVLGLGGVLAVGSAGNRPVRPSYEPASSVRLVDQPAPASRRDDLVSVRPAVLVGP